MDLAKTAFQCIFIALLVIRMIFALNGQTYAIGEINLVFLAFMLLFAILVLDKPEPRGQREPKAVEAGAEPESEPEPEVESEPESEEQLEEAPVSKDKE